MKKSFSNSWNERFVKNAFPLDGKKAFDMY